jgi:hypothetical protein
MKANFNCTKEERKALVTVLSRITGYPAKYQGAPSFSYAVGGYTVDRYGTVDFGDGADRDAVPGFLAELEKEGFSSDGEFEEPAPADNGGCAEAAGSENESGAMSVSVPLFGFTPAALDNLTKLVAAKAWIIRKMTGAAELPIVRDGECLSFPWFKPEASSAETGAYSRLIAGLCKTAKTKKRVTAAEKQPETGDNEKFKARCFLLSLGFIGEESKQARKILLAGFSGSGSHKSGNGGV